MSKSANKGLGKGFGSLLPQDFDQSMLLDKHDRVQKISLTDITADPNQPRKEFDEHAIAELAQSIERYGILQPIVVTEQDGHYHIVAGERRYRAAKKAGLDRVPVLVRSLEELERLEVSLIENVQRVDLNPLEQALSVARLHEQFNISYQDIAQRLGKAHTTVINIVRLLQLPDFARTALSKGKISEGHARAILSVKDEAQQRILVRNIEQNGWSVRRAEQFASEHKKAKKTDKNDINEPELKAIETALYSNDKLASRLNTKWGMKTIIAPRARGGKITLNFDSRDKLDAFIKYLEKS